MSLRESVLPPFCFLAFHREGGEEEEEEEDWFFHCARLVARDQQWRSSTEVVLHLVNDQERYVSPRKLSRAIHLRKRCRVTLSVTSRSYELARAQ